MYLTYLQLIIMSILLLGVGALGSYLLMRRKVTLLRESINALELSLRGMWDNNEDWTKKYTLLQEKYENVLQQKEQVSRKNTTIVPIKPVTVAKFSNGER